MVQILNTERVRTPLSRLLSLAFSALQALYRFTSLLVTFIRLPTWTPGRKAWGRSGQSSWTEWSTPTSWQTYNSQVYSIICARFEKYSCIEISFLNSFNHDVIASCKFSNIHVSIILYGKIHEFIHQDWQTIFFLIRTLWSLIIAQISLYKTKFRGMKVERQDQNVVHRDREVGGRIFRFFSKNFSGFQENKIIKKVGFLCEILFFKGDPKLVWLSLYPERRLMSRDILSSFFKNKRFMYG